MMDFKIYTVRHVVLMLSACVALAACQTTPNNGSTALPSSSSPIDAALQRAASKAADRGKSSESLAYLEKIYRRNSQDSGAALDLAHALREQGDYLRAATILAPFANAKDASGAVQAEYAAIQLGQGKNIIAERFARRALLQDESSALANNYLGIALDARERHDDAERAFRKALENWSGDSTTVMNNLALNLTAQGKLKEAEQILEKAQSYRPDKMELERNLRIVRTLMETHEYKLDIVVPTPSIKPGR